ncbi:LptF/LptG family permease [Bernardetia sp.]|uniref:LptF/LptG family permease n=1 Tax=Bernardetia sp. TaxID=1937974 RepID=UPI0025C08B78|nr:LptF/LptG family permease [Bernardetia sp.]
MFKKIDKLVAHSFFGLFFLTFSVVLFILLMVFMSKYFEDLVGKGLGAEVFAELFFYFSLTLVPQALPLAILLASLMAFGNMGEHNELTAIKGCGISLIRILMPVGLFAIFLTGVAYIFNDRIVPEVNLKAYRLLYDVRQKEPTLDFPEGSFYNGLPGWSIRIGEKVKGTDSLKDLIIYDHRSARGNTDVIIADKGVMRNKQDEQILEFRVENGNRYSEQVANGGKNKNAFVRDKFEQATFNFDLSFLQMNETSEELFTQNRYMMTVAQLNAEADSLLIDAREVEKENASRARSYFDYTFFVDFERERLAQRAASEKKQAELKKAKADSINKVFNKSDSAILAEQNQRVSLDSSNFTTQSQKDSSISVTEVDSAKIRKIDSLKQVNAAAIHNSQQKSKILPSSSGNLSDSISSRLINNNENISYTPNTVSRSNSIEDLDTIDWQNLPDTITVAYQNFSEKSIENVMDRALTKVRNMRSFTHTNGERVERFEYDSRRALLEKNKRYSLAVACFVMFLIGAPLGAIIKKGGLGVPVLISIVFFILFYFMTITGDKWAREKVVSIFIGSWAANILLFVFGILFLLQARADSRLFEIDAYVVLFGKIKRLFVKEKPQEKKETV